MEPSNPSITANTVHSINPTDVVKKVMLYVGAYGLDKGKALFERASELMGFLPWWENEVGTKENDNRATDEQIWRAISAINGRDKILRHQLTVIVFYN